MKKNNKEIRNNIPLWWGIPLENLTGTLKVDITKGLSSHENVVLAQTSAFVTWLLGHILLALNLKQEKLPFFKQGITSNLFGFY